MRVKTLTSTRTGGTVVTIALAPRTARAIDLATGERADGPVFLAADGRRLDRHGAGRIVRKVTRRAGINNAVTPHTLRHAFITAAVWMPGSRCPMSKKLPRMQIREPPKIPQRERIMTGASAQQSPAQPHALPAIGEVGRGTGYLRQDRACHAMTARGTAAAGTWSTVAGFGATLPASTATYWAAVPSRHWSVSPNTSSPTAIPAVPIPAWPRPPTSRRRG